MANKLKHLAIKPITEREKGVQTLEEREVLSEIKGRWKVNRKRRNPKKKKYIKAAARMRFLGFVDTARTKGQPICPSLMKSSEMRG